MGCAPKKLEGGRGLTQQLKDTVETQMQWPHACAKGTINLLGVVGTGFTEEAIQILAGGTAVFLSVFSIIAPKETF